jgi:hypothetical protein
MDINNLNDLDMRLNIESVRTFSTTALEKARFAATHSLRFLANCVLRPNSTKFPSLVERVHGRIIDSFLKPSPKVEWDSWSKLDEFVTLASRGMLKSTLAAALLTQCILCAPDIRILIVSGKLDKAESILATARDPFYCNEVLTHLFSDFQIRDEDRKAGSFTTPRRDPDLNFRDATIETGSFDSVKAGGHYEIVLFDDATNEHNSNNLENCEKTHSLYDSCDPLVEPGGYRLFLGTKWHSDDLPAYIMGKSAVEEEKTRSPSASFFSLPCWTVKIEGTAAEVAARETREKQGTLTEADVILTWPEKLTAKMLFRMYRGNRMDFCKQYLLNASIEQQKSFTPDILQNQITSPSDWRQIPIHDRAVVVHWDFASVYSGRRDISENDYSCGMVALFRKSTGQMWIVDATLAHFTSGDEIANAIINFYKSAMAIGPIVGHSAEDAVGIRAINSSVERLAKAEELPMRAIDFILPQKATKAGGNGKNTNIALLASAMRGPQDPITKKFARGYVFISSNIPHIDEIKSQFEKWSINAKRRKDDAPDCVAQIWKHYRDLINSDFVQVMELAPVLSLEPEPVEVESDADEADADLQYLDSDTTYYHA